MDLAAKKRLKILVHTALKNLAIVIGLIIAVACLNFSIELDGPLFSNCMLEKIRTKKLWRSDVFNVIYNMNILSLIINALINRLCSAHLVKKWEEQEVTIYTWRSNEKIAGFIHLLVVLISIMALYKSSKFKEST